MKPILIAAAILLAVIPIAESQQRTASRQAMRQITFHGCVMPGIDKGTYVLAPVTHLVEPDAGRVPEFAHGRQVFFWLNNDSEVRKHAGRMVEVRGEFSRIEESEAELKAGQHKDCGLVVEFEGIGVHHDRNPRS